MSADNGIYILETKGHEFRVVHCQSIDEITWEPDYYDFNIEELKARFGNCDVYTDQSKAREFAFELMRDIVVLEYGISELNYHHVPFPE